MLNSSAFRPHTTEALSRQGGRAPFLAANMDAAELERRAEPMTSLGRFAFQSGLGLLLTKMAILPELLYIVFHANTYLLYLVGPPAMLGGLLSGAIGRTLKSRVAWYWLAFSCCVMLSLPFSSWIGDSVANFRSYILYCLPLLFVVGGLAVKWGHIRGIFYTMAAAGLLDILGARFFAREENGRVNIEESGTIGNSNDLASHLILLIPFILFVVMDKRRNSVLRCLLLLPVAYSLTVILGTASRGALIALAVMALFTLVKATPSQRALALVFIAVGIVALPMALSDSAKVRLMTLFGGQNEEADESHDSRAYLLRMSILYTLNHPVFGVGMAQFPNFEGVSAKAEGRIGNWHQTHNSFTQVSSECGVPALVFFVVSIGGAMLSVNKAYRRARREGFRDISNACFCYLLSMMGFLTTIVFLANAYRFYLSAMIGLAIALSAIATREMSAGRASGTVANPGVAAR